MAISDYSKIYMAVPAYGMDQIFDSFEGTLHIGAPSSTDVNKIVDKTISLPIAGNCYYEGIFSSDGGSQWQPFGVYQPNLSTPSQPVFQTVTLQGHTEPAKLILEATNWYDLVHDTSQAYDLLYKVVVFAKIGQIILPDSNTSQVLRYNSSFNYQKIVFQDSVSFTPSGGVVNTITIAHNLGRVPMFRCFYRPNDSAWPANSIYTLDSIPFTAAVDENNFYFIDDESGVSTPLWPKGHFDYRIYLDA